MVRRWHAWKKSCLRLALERNNGECKIVDNKNITLLWFRRDLRLRDNPALDWVCKNADTVLPVYIHQHEKHWPAGGASRWWLHNSLQQLETRLAKAGLKLHFFSGDSQKIIEKLIAQHNVTDLVFNHIYEPNYRQRDAALKKCLSEAVRLHTFDTGLFFTPGEVLNNQQLPYRVFTPFYKKIRPLLDAQFHQHGSISAAASDESLQRLKSVECTAGSDLCTLDLLDDNGWHEKLHNYWQPGEQATDNRIEKFIDVALEDYQQARDIPSLDGTSMLSAHLHFGEITPQQLYADLWPQLQGEQGGDAMRSAEIFIKQLVWREFAHHVLWHFPYTSDLPMNARFKDAFWHYDEATFTRWRRGETGVPIVDAGMKQLWETGWMHNRVRMITSSFLSKNLGIHWIYGARWFWHTLVDADLANNSMGWQWVAGCGVDAAPYYRVFNPLTQTRRFDEKYHYVNRWLSEHVAADYSPAMIDLAESRQRALARYKQNIISKK